MMTQADAVAHLYSDLPLKTQRQGFRRMVSTCVDMTGCLAHLAAS